MRFAVLQKIKLVILYFDLLQSFLYSCFIQPFVTELDLRQALIPTGSIEYLTQAMPRLNEEQLDFESWLSNVFI